ncbi:MAG: type IX secretion system membrane protein PorP/SprF [Bacteroidota bacterium]
MKRFLAQAILILALLVATTSQTFAQDPQYSQFYSNLVMLNPAFTGSGIGPRVALNSRGQWIKIPGFYQQFAASYDQPVQFLGTTQGIGVNFSADRAGEGDLTKLNVTFNYAYQLEVADDNFLRFGLSGGIIQASIDPFKLTFPDQLDPLNGGVGATREPIQEWTTNRLTEDVNAGVAFFNEFAWVGLTVNHITQPDEIFTLRGSGVDRRLPRKYTLTGGLNIPLRSMRSRRDVSITPAFLTKFQGDFFQVDAGLYVNADPMVFGMWYRHQDAVIGLVGIRYENISFGISYDYTISELRQANSGGSIEASVVMEFESRRNFKPMKHRKLPCPKF